jgi:AraC-like DNA-binding protein
MSAASLHSSNAPPEHWEALSQGADQAVETLDLRSGATLVLSRFDPGATRSFSFTEPEDTFGFGFHLRGGARFAMENCRFATHAFEVWTCAAPRGATSQFFLPSDGFRTVSIRFEPQIAEEVFAEGLALPKGARDILKRVREHIGIARLAPLAAAAVARLEMMFTTPYSDAARRLYLESCALDLLAGQAASLSGRARNQYRVQPRHREQAFAARDHLDNQLQNPPTIAELSKIVGTNEFTLKRAFKETQGTTIFAYVSRRRMEHATFLLQQGMTVSLAAQEVGYSCVRSFSAAFRRQVGCPPSIMRRADP